MQNSDSCQSLGHHDDTRDRGCDTRDRGCDTDHDAYEVRGGCSEACARPMGVNTRSVSTTRTTVSAAHNQNCHHQRSNKWQGSRRLFLSGVGHEGRFTHEESGRRCRHHRDGLVQGWELASSLGRGVSGVRGITRVAPALRRVSRRPSHNVIAAARCTL